MFRTGFWAAKYWAGRHWGAASGGGSLPDGARVFTIRWPADAHQEQPCPPEAEQPCEVGDDLLILLGISRRIQKRRERRWRIKE